jgi:peptidoglycan hydrolase-like protein with peptidoglycan-binding domain
VVVHHAQQPSQERFKEIQQALVTKGYFHGEPDGTWGPASVDALKHFQHDQNLVEDGKIGSLSLIALGLGPKRDATESPQKTAEPEQKIP